MAGSKDVTSFFENHGSIIIITFLFFISVLYISRKVKLKEENCTNLKSKRGNDKNDLSTFYSFNELRNANYFKSGATNNYNCKLKDFYFKSAYNCFCSGIFVNDYVDDCAVTNCAEMGVRFLDMQLFSLNKLPIIAANHDHGHDHKSTYNHIDFDDGMKTIKTEFLDGGDNKVAFPLFLHLRLNYASLNKDYGGEEKKNFYNQVHDTLIDVFDKDNRLFTKNQRIFYNDYDDSREQIIANLPIEDCEGKVFIFITLNDNSSSSDNFKKSKLNQITDLLSTYEQSLVVVHSDEIVDDNYISFQGLSQRKMVVSFPQKDKVNNNNYDFSNAVSNGVQFVCMNHQRFDDYLRVYNDFFVSQIGSSSDNVASPMIKKPDILLNTTGTSDSFFIPSMTYKVMTGTDNDEICHDLSSNDTSAMACIDASDSNYTDVSNSNYKLFNIIQSPDDTEKYYFKTSIQEKICDLSGDGLVYCDANFPEKSSYFKFTRTGADEFKISDVSNNLFCRTDSKNSNKITCDKSDISFAPIFSINKTLL